jgi:hypothetical protein
MYIRFIPQLSPCPIAIFRSLRFTLYYLFAASKKAGLLIDECESESSMREECERYGCQAGRHARRQGKIGRKGEVRRIGLLRN